MTEAILQLLSSVGVRMAHPGNGGEFIGCCPVHDDSNPSWAVNFSKPNYPCHCFACDGGTGYLHSIIMRRFHISRDEAMRRIARYVPMPIVAAPESSNELFREFEHIEEMLEFTMRRLPIPALLARGIPLSIQQRAGLGHTSHGGILIPWRENGKVVCVEERRGSRRWKWGGSKMSEHLYAPFGIHRTMILTEGMTDVLRSAALGMFNVAGIGGSSFTETHARLLCKGGMETAYLAFDLDRAGDVPKRTAARQLASMAKVFIMPLPPGVQDLGEMPSWSLFQQALRRSLPAAVFFSTNSVFKLDKQNRRL